LNRRDFVKATTCAAGFPVLSRASSEGSDEQRWLAVAESLKPSLRRTSLLPAGIVNMVADDAEFLHWRW